MGKFMDKFEKGVDSVVSKTNDFIDTTSLRGKINDEEKNIEDQKQKMGEFYWKLHQKGTELDEGAAKFIKSIEASLKKIDGYQAEIDGKKNKKDSADEEEKEE